VVSLARTNGWIRLTGTNEDAEGVAVGTEVVYSPTLNGPLALEARVESAALTARNLWVGFCGLNIDLVDPPCTGDTTTITPVADDYCGFHFDSSLTDGDWHMVYNGGTTTGATTSTDVAAGNNLEAGTLVQVLRVEIDRNGTARWYVDGVLKQTITNAVSTTVLQAGYVGCFGTTTTATSLDVDYLAIEANRDWTV
jgi:hypothetical protein